jgi:hypothetical protein
MPAKPSLAVYNPGTVLSRLRTHATVNATVCALFFAPPLKSCGWHDELQHGIGPCCCVHGIYGSMAVFVGWGGGGGGAAGAGAACRRCWLRCRPRRSAGATLPCKPRLLLCCPDPPKGCAAPLRLPGMRGTQPTRPAYLREPGKPAGGGWRGGFAHRALGVCGVMTSASQRAAAQNAARALRASHDCSVVRPVFASTHPFDSLSAPHLRPPKWLPDRASWTCRRMRWSSSWPAVATSLGKSCAWRSLGSPLWRRRP